MKELEKLQNKGWRFVIWLSPNGGCIIQGKRFMPDDDSGDWEFEAQASNFSLAVKQAVWEVKMQQRKMKGEE